MFKYNYCYHSLKFFIYHEIKLDWQKLMKIYLKTKINFYF